MSLSKVVYVRLPLALAHDVKRAASELRVKQSEAHRFLLGLGLQSLREKARPQPEQMKGG